MGGRGVEQRILVQQPGVRGITPPLASEKSTGSRSRAAPSVISWPQHSPSFHRCRMRVSERICTRRFFLADEYPRSLQNAECSDLILELHPPSRQKNAEGKEIEQHIKLCSLSKL